MGINQSKDAFEKDLENKGLISSVYNLNLCTVFDTEKNEYFASDTSKPSEDKLVHFINYSWGLWQKRVIEDGFILMPVEPSNAIKTALSYQCFEFIKVAQVYRDHGFDIPKRAEDEQSFFLHKFLILAIKHGKDFIKVFNDETKAMIESREQSHD